MLFEGLSARQLCKTFGLNYRTIMAEAKQSNCHPDRVLARKTGWILRFEFFYAPDPLLLQSDFPMIQLVHRIEE